MTTSTLTQKQVRTFARTYFDGETKYEIVAEVRHDDQCGNGHNTFSVTGDLREVCRNGRRRFLSGGCIHDELARHFPQLVPSIKFHLCSSNGPLHYLANTEYWVKEGNLAHARSTAIWPDATDADLAADGLRERLEARLPALMEEFEVVVKSFGFTY